MPMICRFTQPRFDWYQGSFKEQLNKQPMDPEYLLMLAKGWWELADIVPTRPRIPQYQTGVDFKRGERVIFHLCWGGCNGDPHFMSTGSSAQEFYEWLVRRQFIYAVSRADVCVDTVDPEAFERLIHYQKGFVNQHKMKQDQAGDWAVDGSPAGRTFYVGSRKSGSQAFTRTYEKGKQLGANPLWVRFELECRPQSGESKRALAGAPPWHVLQSVKWVRTLLAGMYEFAAFQIATTSISTTWTATDDQKAYLALIRQYGKRLLADAESLPNGWVGVGLKLKALMEQAENHRQAIGGIGESNPYEQACEQVMKGTDIPSLGGVVNPSRVVNE